MSNEITKEPEIRFDGYEKDWEQRKFEDIAIRVNKSSNSYSLPKVEFEDIVAGEGRLNKDVTKKFDSRKGVEFLPEDILYGKLRPYLKNWLKSSFKGVALGDFWVLRPNGTDPDFMYSLIQSDKYQKAANDTSGTKMPRSDWKKVSRTDFFIPLNINEQKQIGSFFKQLDTTITLHRRELDLLEQTKQTYLKKMFPKTGEDKPEIRFAEFTDAWEQRKLGEIFNYKQGVQVPVENQYEEYREGLSRFIRIIDLTSENEPPRYIKYSGKNSITEDVLFMVRYGQPGLVKYGYKGIIANNLFSLQPKDEIHVPFFYTLLGKENGHLLSLSSSTTMPAINFKALNALVISIPNFEEQKKIGIFFKQLDDTITLHQRELDSLKEMKKTLLQKMFV